jgi:hypothetical protein
MGEDYTKKCREEGSKEDEKIHDIFFFIPGLTLADEPGAWVDPDNREVTATIVWESCI